MLHIVAIAHHATHEIVAAASNLGNHVSDVSACAALGCRQCEAKLSQPLPHYLRQRFVGIGNYALAQELVKLTRQPIHIVIQQLAVGMCTREPQPYNPLSRKISQVDIAGHILLKLL